MRVLLVIALFCNLDQLRALEVRIVNAPARDVADDIHALQACGVRGEIVHWRTRPRYSWNVHFLVTEVPARVSSTCSAPWIFLHDDTFRTALRRHVLEGSGLLLEIRAPGNATTSVQTMADTLWRKIAEREPVAPAAVVLTQASDVFLYEKFVQYARDLSTDYVEEMSSQLDMLGRQILIDNTISFVLEVRSLAAKLRSLRSASQTRSVEYLYSPEGGVQRFSLARGVYHSLRRREVLRAFSERFAVRFRQSYEQLREELPRAVLTKYNAFLLKNLTNADVEVLGLESLMKRIQSCAEQLNALSLGLPQARKPEL